MGWIMQKGGNSASSPNPRMGSCDLSFPTMDGGESTNAQHNTQVPRSPHTDPKMRRHPDLQPIHVNHSHLPERTGNTREGVIEGVLREKDWKKFRDLRLELNLS